MELGLLWRQQKKHSCSVAIFEFGVVCGNLNNLNLIWAKRAGAGELQVESRGGTVTSEYKSSSSGFNRFQPETQMIVSRYCSCEREIHHLMARGKS